MKELLEALFAAKEVADRQFLEYSRKVLAQQSDDDRVNRDDPFYNDMMHTSKWMSGQLSTTIEGLLHDSKRHG